MSFCRTFTERWRRPGLRFAVAFTDPLYLPDSLIAKSRKESSMKKISVLAAAIATLAVAAPTATAATPKLIATVGPNDTISLRTAGGAPVRSVKAGTYTIVVRDRASDHNFRLVGPGINKATGIGSMGTQTWRVRFARGKTYRFICEPHADDMRGSFRAR
jgi:hypothetical protein